MRGSRVLIAFVIASCNAPSVDLEGKQCPCAPGYRCDDTTHTCTTHDAGIDSASDAAICNIAFVKSVLAIGVDTAKFPNGNTTGNFIVAGISLSGSTDTVTGVTDSEGNTYSRAAGLGEQDDNFYGYYVVWFAPVTGGSNFDNTLTVAPTAQHVFAAEYTCVATSNPFDAIAGAMHIAAPYSLTCAEDRELIVSVAGFQGGGTNWTVGGNDRSGLLNKSYEYSDFIGVAGPNSVSVLTSVGHMPGGIAVSFKPTH
jgi:hypothetical protein